MKNISLIKKNFFWTKHAREKMRHYNLSEQRIKRVFRHPARIEEGVAPETIAVMQRAGSKKHPYEAWLMYQVKDETIKIISAWRYPGMTKAGERVPVPREIVEELGITCQ